MTESLPQHRYIWRGLADNDKQMVCMNCGETIGGHCMHFRGYSDWYCPVYTCCGSDCVSSICPVRIESACVDVAALT